MRNTIFIGDIQTGYDSYSQRTDTFITTLCAKIESIKKICADNFATPIIIGQVKERNADLYNLPKIISVLTSGDFSAIESKRKQAPIFDVLTASKAISTTMPDDFKVIDDPKDIPITLLKSSSPQAIIYTGDYADLIPMESVIVDAHHENKLKAIICNSKENHSKIAGVYAVNPLFRSKQESPIPKALLVTDDEIKFVDIEHNAHVFLLESVSYDAEEETTSNFVSRLKQESDNLKSNSYVMDSQKNLEKLVTQFSSKVNLSSVSREIVNNLMNHTNS